MLLRPDHPVLSVVSPPRAERFFELAGVAPGDSVRADFSGWSKLVLLTPELAVLFPRDHTMVEPLRREIEALRAVAPAGIPEVPEVVAIWEDAGISPYPVLALRRLPGVSLEAVLPELGAGVLADVIEQLGRLAGRWHGVPPGPLARRPPRELGHRAALDDLLGARATAPDAGGAIGRVFGTLGLAREDEPRARTALRRVRQLAAVIAHGDVHEGQVLVDPADGYRVTGVLDWQTATVDHPFTDFDLGEWGPALWRRHRARFPAFRRRWWDAYAASRAVPRDLGAAFEWCWSVSHAMWLAGEPASADPEVTGTLDEAIEAAGSATAALAP